MSVDSASQLSLHTHIQSTYKRPNPRTQYLADIVAEQQHVARRKIPDRQQSKQQATTKSGLSDFRFLLHIVVPPLIYSATLRPNPIVSFHHIPVDKAQTVQILHAARNLVSVAQSLEL